MDILNIDGNVKSVETISYHYTEEEGRYLYEKRIVFYDQENRTLHDTYYDEEGVITQKMIITHNENEDITNISSFAAENKLEMKSIFIYDEKGNILEQIADTYRRGHTQKKSLHTYDEEGKKIAIEIYENGILVSKTTLKNDEKNSTEIDYDEDGNITRKIEKLFDENKNIITRKVYERGKLIIIEENSYDENGNLCEKIVDNLKTKVQIREIKRYNDFNKVVEYSRRFTGNSNLYFKLIFEYDEKGNLIKEYKISDEEEGSVSYSDIHTYKYDGQNNVLEECEYDEEGEIYRKITYEYDERGNEIKKIKKRGDELIVAEHTIEYY